LAQKLGLLDHDPGRWLAFCTRQKTMQAALDQLRGTVLPPTAGINDALLRLGTTALSRPLSLLEILRRPEVGLLALRQSFLPEAQALDPLIAERIETQVKYEGYLGRQAEDAARFSALEAMALPQDLDYGEVPGLSREVVEKLARHRPQSLGQASRIPGITPAAVNLLGLLLRKTPHKEEGA
jgi:tRNA uridine 5-carboxymethylaminomethyl modification enzyme